LLPVFCYIFIVVYLLMPPPVHLTSQHVTVACISHLPTQCRINFHHFRCKIPNFRYALNTPIGVIFH
jgi:hypothetical protein